MITMLNEEGLTFKEIEEEIFKMVCEWGQSFAKDFLESHDLHEVEEHTEKDVIPKKICMNLGEQEMPSILKSSKSYFL